MFSCDVNTTFSRPIYSLYMANTETPLDRLLSEVKRRKWKDVELCRRLGISPQRLNNWKERGLPISVAPEIAAKLNMSLDHLIMGRQHEQHAEHRTEEPLALYRTEPSKQKQLLELFDQLTPSQQETVLDELRAHVDANLAVVQHFQGKKLRHADNRRVEETYGLPPSRKTVRVPQK